MTNDLVEKRAQLIQNLREQTSCKTRTSFCKKYDIPVPTLKQWEKGFHKEISVSGLRKLVNAFQQEGLDCDEEYILNAGAKAGSLENSNARILQSMEEAEELDEKLTAHLNYLTEYYSPIDIAIIEGKALDPVFKEGDIVAGQKQKPEFIKEGLNQLNIIKTLNNKTYVLFLEKTTLPNIYFLKQLSNQLSSGILLNVAEIVYFAPVIFTYRPK